MHPVYILWIAISGWVYREQSKLIEYLQAENRALREQLGNRRLRFTDAQRRRLAVKGKALGRMLLREYACIVSPDTILRWYRDLIAKKYDGSAKRSPGRPQTASEIQALVRSSCAWPEKTRAGATHASVTRAGLAPLTWTGKWRQYDPTDEVE